ncbi:MAG: hypothetical protein JNL02_11285 [Saprospiraceae bacterium]|nr:hypothetical protein [Saprospiraceae bacterium]
MKNICFYFIFGIALLSGRALSAQNDTLPPGFGQLLARTQLTFLQPEGMTSVPCIENGQMNYEYALKLPGRNFEIRYAIRPMDSLLIQHQNEVKNGATAIHPNKWAGAVFNATLLNISAGGPNSGILPEVSTFPPEAVAEEFGADWGAVAFVLLGPEFGGTTYKYCLAMTIHRDNVGDAYVFYLSDDNQTMSELMEKPFHALRFR